jgi:hypothetical protein
MNGSFYNALSLLFLLGWNRKPVVYYTMVVEYDLNINILLGVFTLVYMGTSCS